MNGVDSEILARTPVPQLPPLPLILHLSLRKLRQILCLVFIQAYKVKGFEIMDMKKCAAIPPQHTC